MKYSRLYLHSLVTFKSLLTNFMLFSLLISSKGLCETVRLLEVYGEGTSRIVENKLVTRLLINEQGISPSKLTILIDKKSNYIKTIALSNGIDDNKISFTEIQQIMLQKSLHNPDHVISLKKDNDSAVYLGNSVLLQQHRNKLEYMPEYKLSRYVIVNFENTQQRQLFLGQVSHIAKQDFIYSSSIEERQLYYQKALLKAIDNASIKARLISKKTEMKLGHIISLQELSYDFLKIKNNVNSSLPYFVTNHHDTKRPNVSARVLIKFKLLD